MENTRKNAVIPGSFDPITVGHLDIIERAAVLFDEVFVAVFQNSEKHGMFTPEEKLHMIKLATAHLQNVHCSVESGLTVDFAAAHHAVLVKGVRNVADFDYEMSLAYIYQDMDNTVDTIFLPAKQEYLHISSSYVRELLHYGRPLDGVVPTAVRLYLEDEWKMEK